MQDTSKLSWRFPDYAAINIVDFVKALSVSIHMGKIINTEVMEYFEQDHYQEVLMGLF